MTTIKTYGETETPSSEIPAGFERISLVEGQPKGHAEPYVCYQVEKKDGSFYLCDADGDVVNTMSEWFLLRVLADVAADDSDAFFEVIEATAKRVETTTDQTDFQSHICNRDWFEAARMVAAHAEESLTDSDGMDVIQDWMSHGSWDGTETPESVAREWDELQRERP